MRTAVEFSGQLDAKRFVALGESQSALYMTTYINAVDPLAEVYDGFLVHSRFGPAAPLDGSSIFEEQHRTTDAVRFRPDLRVPVITIITETDLLGGPRVGYHKARQPDSDRLRVWEIPGSAHADNYTIHVAPIDTGTAPLRDIVAAYAPTDMLMGEKLAHCINFAPQHHYVVQAALAGLHEWVQEGDPPPKAPPIRLTETVPAKLIVDEDGIATGGIRTPWVDVPLARTSGLGCSQNALSMIFGSGEMFDADTLHRLYPRGAVEYVERFTSALNSAIEARFVLARDRQEILAIATAMYPAP